MALRRTGRDGHSPTLPAANYNGQEQLNTLPGPHGSSGSSPAACRAGPPPDGLLVSPALTPGTVHQSPPAPPPVVHENRPASGGERRAPAAANRRRHAPPGEEGGAGGAPGVPASQPRRRRPLPAPPTTRWDGAAASRPALGTGVK